MPEFEFPSEEARQAKLFVPKEYDPYQNESDRRRCFIKYNIKQKSFVIVADDNEEIMDIVAVDDVIGASIEIELLPSEESLEPRAVAATFQNSPVSQGPSSPVEPGIFQPISEDADNIFTVVNGDNAPRSPIPFDSQATAKLTIYVYPRKDPLKDSAWTVTSCMGKKNAQPAKEFNTELKPSKLLHRYPQHRTFQVAPTEDFADISVLVKAIRRLARPASVSSRERLLVIVNPFSGRKRGMDIYNSVVMPMLEQAAIDYDHVITTHAGHAEEQMAPKDGKGDLDGIADITKYEGLVVIGGDGSVYEIMQGIKKRPDCEKVLKNLKLGHIGAGTSNGLSASLAHASQEHNTATDYSFIVAKGNTVPTDLSRYETGSSDYLSFLTFSWSLIADIDIESEALRWMGWLRMEIYSAWRVLNLRSYRARLMYLPASAERNEKLPPLSQPLSEKEGWLTIEDDFCLFWVSQVTHAGEAMLNHPMCKPDDGLFHIFLVRNSVSRLRMLLILLGFETGSHVNMDSAEFIDCTAFRLEPLSKGSYNDLDGEVIESGPVQGMVLPSATRAYCIL